VLGVWIALIVGAVLVYPHLMSNLSAPDYSVTGSDSAKVTDLIQADFSAAGVEQDVIVFNSETLKVTDREYRKVIDRVIEAVKGEPGVVGGGQPDRSRGAGPDLRGRTLGLRLAGPERG
jgi:RND superfamily putative drug exporter